MMKDWIEVFKHDLQLSRISFMNASLLGVACACIGPDQAYWPGFCVQKVRSVKKEILILRCNLVALLCEKVSSMWLLACCTNKPRFLQHHIAGIIEPYFCPVLQNAWCLWLQILGLSAGQLCDLRTRPVHIASRTAIYGFSTISDDATALRWSQVDRSTRAHSFDISHYA